MVWLPGEKFVVKSAAVADAVPRGVEHEPGHEAHGAKQVLGSQRRREPAFGLEDPLEALRQVAHAGDLEEIHLVLMGRDAGHGDALARGERGLDDKARVDLVAVRDVGQDELRVGVDLEALKPPADARVERHLGRGVDATPRREVIGPQRALVSVGTV